MASLETIFALKLRCFEVQDFTYTIIIGLLRFYAARLSAITQPFTPTQKTQKRKTYSLPNQGLLMSKGIVIAIDGYSGTGKSTTAKGVATELGYIYVDTGAMYRAVTLAFIRGSVDASLPEKVEEALVDIKINFVLNEELGVQETYLNDENVESEIRGIVVSDKVSEVSAVSAVRRQLVAQQRAMGEVGGIVMDGRDIGTVVFPEAELKIFMTASDEIRAERRWNELLGQGKSVSKEEVLHNLRSRDEIDTSRADSPLRKADDAIVIDTSNITIEQQVKDILKLAKGNLDRDI